MTTLLGICGALRAESTNRKLMKLAVRAFAPDTFVEGGIRLPLYDGDLETAEGIPAAVQTLADQIAAADAVIITSPEYNKSVAGGLKNALDWVSRTKGRPWQDKPVAILSANSGRSGGERGQSALRLALSPFGARLLAGREVLVGDSRHQFDDADELIDERYRKALQTQMDALRALVG
jgi:chromate reductase